MPWVTSLRRICWQVCARYARRTVKENEMTLDNEQFDAATMLGRWVS